MHIVYGLLIIAAGFVIEVYTFQIVKNFGHQEWAEQRLGPGGTYTFWRLVGLVGIVLGFATLFKNPFGL